MSKSATSISEIKAVVFDFSGLIIDDRQLTCLIVNDVLEKFGKQRITMSEFQQEFELPFYRIFGKHGIDEKIAGRVALQTYHENYAKYEHLVKIVGDAKLCIKFLVDNGIKVGIVSQTPRKELERQLDKNGIGFLKPYTVALKDAAEEKPSPLPLFLCMERLGTSNDATVFVGDQFEDVQCGKNARVLQIAVCNPKVSYHTKSKLIDAKPDYLIKNLRDLIKIFQERTLVIA